MEEGTLSAILGTMAMAFVAFVGIPFAIYAWMGFMSWVYNDPYNWIADIKPAEQRQEEDPDVIACREKGGVAIMSGWTGGIRECQIPTP